MGFFEFIWSCGLRISCFDFFDGPIASKKGQTIAFANRTYGATLPTPWAVWRPDDPQVTTIFVQAGPT